MDIMECFPPGMVPRKDQIDILKAVQDYEKTYDKIIICAPTGIGKSAIAYAIAKYYDDSWILVGTKNLQRQYARSFPDIPMVIGKNNFGCQYLVDKKQGILGINGDIGYLKKNKLTCDYGPCTKRLGNEDDPCEHIESCEYYVQRNRALISPIAITNYSFFIHMKNIPNQDGMNRYCSIMDEAHSLEDQFVSFMGSSIGRYEFDTLGVNLDSHDIEGVCKMYDDCRHEIKLLMKKPENQANIPALQKRYDRYEKMFLELHDDPDNFVLEIDRDAGRVIRVRLQPLNMGKYMSRYIDSPKSIFMSGTINRTDFCRSVGINKEDVLLLEIEENPFPIKNRKVEFLDVSSLSAGSSETDIIQIHAAIDGICENHKNERGLILTSSKQKVESIMEWSAPMTRARLIEAHSENSNGTSIEDSLKRLASTNNGILVSSSLWEGCSLDDDLCRFIIIAKTPFPYLGDARIKRLADNNWGWYAYQTITKMLQGMGRGVRNQKDRCTTYFVDKKSKKLFERNRAMVPVAYHTAIYGGDMK